MKVHREILNVCVAVTSLSLTVCAVADSPPYILLDRLDVQNCSGIDLTPDDSRIVCIDGQGGFHTVASVFDANTLAKLYDVCGFSSVPWRVRASGNDGEIWTAQYYGGSAQRFSLSDCSIDCNLDVGSWPVDLLFDDNRRYLFVGEYHPGGGSSGPGSVLVIDTWQCQIVASVDLTGQASRVARAPRDRYLYVTGTRGSAGASEILHKFDMESFEVVATLDLGDIGNDVGLSVHPDHSVVYVPDPTSNRVRVVDTDSMQVTDTLDFGFPIRHFWVAPSGDHAIVSGDNHSTLDVYDLSSRAIVQRIEVGIDNASWKREVVWSQDRSSVYVALATESNSVAVLGVSRQLCDVNGDGSCDHNDLQALRDQLPACFSADTNCDGLVDLFDLLTVLDEWGDCP